MRILLYQPTALPNANALPLKKTIFLNEKCKNLNFEISLKTDRRNLKIGLLTQFFTLNKNIPTKNTGSPVFLTKNRQQFHRQTGRRAPRPPLPASLPTKKG